jgi:hypothetical protein
MLQHRLCQRCHCEFMADTSDFSQLLLAKRSPSTVVGSRRFWLYISLYYLFVLLFFTQDNILTHRCGDCHRTICYRCCGSTSLILTSSSAVGPPGTENRLCDTHQRCRDCVRRSLKPNITVGDPTAGTVFSEQQPCSSVSAVRRKGGVDWDSVSCALCGTGFTFFRRR